MLCTNHYRLGDLTQKRVTELVEQLGTSGWYEALNMQGVLKSVLQRATESPSLAVRLMPSANSMNSRGINGPVLREITGLPFTGPEVPMDIRRQLFELAKRPWPAESKLRAAGYAPGSSLKTTMESFNRLSLLPPPADCLAFLPFPSISAQMKHLGKAPGQTPNLALDDAARIFRACTTWLYDRAPLLLEVLASARAVFERREADAVTTHTIDTQASRAARATAARLTSPHATPHWMENLALKKGENSLARRLYMVQIAAACQIGINHGRRVNEVVGEKLPYGIYRGCVRPVAGLLHEWRIDIYCEKNTQGYRSFPANALVFDAVSVLEKLANLLRPLNTLPLAVNADIAAARTERLLTTRNLTSWGFREPLYDVNFRDYLTEFLVDAGVNPEKFHGQQWPFRRFFCILYTNKHDNPELLALSEHLDHLGVPSTLPYQHDRIPRAQGGTVKEQMNEHDPDAEGMLREMREANIEHLLDKVERMLNGEAVGGFFPRLVRRLAKTLSGRVNFRRADSARKAHTITELLVKHGYVSNAMPHTTCVADRPKATARMAKCSRDGEVHREDASEHTCSGCVHSMTASTQIDRLRQLAKRARVAAKDSSLPSAVQQASSLHASEMARLAAAEAEIAQENKAMFDRLVTSWGTELVNGQ
jgi:hypothetical protein